LGDCSNPSPFREPFGESQCQSKQRSQCQSQCNTNTTSYAWTNTTSYSTSHRSTNSITVAKCCHSRTHIHAHTMYSESIW